MQKVLSFLFADENAATSVEWRATAHVLHQNRAGLCSNTAASAIPSASSGDSAKLGVDEILRLSSSSSHIREDSHSPNSP